VTWLQALRFFFREASLNLLRGWKVSLLAVLTIAVSLFIGGALWMVGDNLARSIDQWRGQMRVVVYLKPAPAPETLARLAAEARSAFGVTGVEVITARQARARFREIFPGLSELVEGWESEPLPSSLEISFRPSAGDQPSFKAWLAAWKTKPEVALIDDDREWLGQLQSAVAVVRAVSLALVAGLLGAAIFTIASVIRLTAYLHHEEISIMRLVGSTEFFIRGPFYAEGMLQGLLGGLIASGTLFGLFALLREKAQTSLVPSLVAQRFLPVSQIALLVGLGALAGLLGAITSLRREQL
jgi:cell division transport system permease protein